MWSTVLVVVAAGVIAWQASVTRRRARGLRSDVEGLSKEVFGATLIPPTVEISSSYGYPSFQVTFPSNDLLARARHGGQTGLFLVGIQALCKNSGSKRRPFDASVAIWFTSREELARIAQNAAIRRE